MNKDSLLYKVVLLGVLCAICGLALSGMNGLTAPLIAAQTLAKEQANLEKLYPGATFTEVTDYEDSTGLVTGVYEAEGKGKIYKLSVVGYNSSGFTFMLAYDEDGTLSGFVPIEQNETNGFGSKCFEEPYVSSVIGIKAGEEIPLLSGATLTSRAIRNGGIAASALFTGGEAVISEPEPVVVKVDDDYTDYEAACEETSNDGATAVYACSAKGYGLVTGAQGDHDYKKNKADITINLADFTVAGIELTRFGDTEGIGDKATAGSALEKYVGLGATDEVDFASGATFTSKSVTAMVQAAINMAQGN